MKMPDRIWINKVYGQHPDDWDFTDGKYLTKAQLRQKVEYVRLDPTVLAALPEVMALVLAERERCANVAEDAAPVTQDMNHTFIADACYRIAAAIRKGAAHE